MEIKLMTLRDCNRAYSLWARTPGMEVFTKDDSPEGIARFLRRNPSTSFIALDGHKTIGTIMGGHDGRRGYIYNVCVDASYRIEGLGRQLIERSLNALHAEEITRVMITTKIDNIAGNAFWSRLGWDIRGDLNVYDHILDEDNKPVHIAKRNK